LFLLQITVIQTLIGRSQWPLHFDLITDSIASHIVSSEPPLACHVGRNVCFQVVSHSLHLQLDAATEDSPQCVCYLQCLLCSQLTVSALLAAGCLFFWHALPSQSAASPGETWGSYAFLSWLAGQSNSRCVGAERSTQSWLRTHAAPSAALGVRAALSLLLPCVTCSLASLAGLDYFSGDVFFNFDPGIFEVWDPSNQLRAELSFTSLLDVLTNVAYAFENKSLRFESILQALCDEAAPCILFF
jgi:hypothetical protein